MLLESSDERIPVIFGDKWIFMPEKKAYCRWWSIKLVDLQSLNALPISSGICIFSFIKLIEIFFQGVDGLDYWIAI